MVVHGSGSRADTGLQAIFDDAVPPARTSAAAELALVSGLGSLLAVPFSILFGPAAVLGLLAVTAGFVGMITTSRSDVAGSALTGFGLAFGLVALALIGLRYLGLDTALGDDLVPWLSDLLRDSNSWLPQP